MSMKTFRQLPKGGIAVRRTIYRTEATMNDADVFQSGLLKAFYRTNP